MRPRSLGRRLALQYLYMNDLLGYRDAQNPEEFLREHCDQPEAGEFARRLIDATIPCRPAIDRAIEDVADHWDLDRIAPVERNVLRLGYAELLEETAPPGVIIDEAVELAKNFGSRDSGKFVNGILDRLRRELAERAEPADGFGKDRS